MLLVDINKFLAELVDFIEIGWFPSKHLAFKYSPYFFFNRTIFFGLCEGYSKRLMSAFFIHFLCGWDCCPVRTANCVQVLRAGK